MKLVCATSSHFRAEDLEATARATGAGVSSATIYRTLPILEEANIIRRTTAYRKKSQGALYEHVWGGEHHDHLLCSGCGKTVEFSYPAIEVLQEAVAAEHGFTLERHHLELVGRCADCEGSSKKTKSK